MLHPGQTLRRAHDLPQTFFIKFVGKSSRGFSTKRGPHRDHVILLGDVLMNGVVGEASQRKPSTGEKNFDLTCGRKFPNTAEELARLFSIQHHNILRISTSATLN